MPELTHYSCMLRLWRDHARAPWRVTLIAVAQPDAHQHFATLDALFAFLTTQTKPVLAVQQMSMQIECEHDHYTPGGVAREAPLE